MGAQGVELAANDRLQRLDHVIGVDPCVNSAQLTVLSEPLKAPSLGLVVARENEWHGRYFTPNIADLSLF